MTNFFQDTRKIKMFKLIEQAEKDYLKFEELVNTTRDLYYKNSNDPLVAIMLHEIRKRIWPEEFFKNNSNTNIDWNAIIKKHLDLLPKNSEEAEKMFDSFKANHARYVAHSYHSNSAVTLKQTD